MVRRYDDAIDVRMQSDEDETGPRPAAFVWRDRLYVVRAVQTRWYERRAWWREAAAAALLGLRGDESRPGVVLAPTSDYLDGETEVWRVEAAAGRSFPVGVFDLARSVPAASADAAAAVGASSGWRLTRVAD